MGLQRLNLLRLFVYANKMYTMGMEPTLGAHIDFDKTQIMVTVSSKK